MLFGRSAGMLFGRSAGARNPLDNENEKNDRKYSTHFTPNLPCFSVYSVAKKQFLVHFEYNRSFENHLRFCRYSSGIASPEDHGVSLW